MSGYANISAVPDQNILYNAASGQTLLANQRNQLLNQEAQQAIGGNEMEMASRLANTVLDQTRYPTPEARAAAYPTLLANARALAPGYFKNAPATYPGDDVAHALASWGTPSAEQYKQQTNAAGVDAYGRTVGIGASGAGGGAGGGGAPLSSDKATALKQIAQRESGGDPTALNYVAREDPTAYDRGATASGKYQIVNSTWAEGAGLAGVDVAKYPTARSAPEAVQDQVASALWDKHGNAPWQKGAQDWVKGAGGRYALQAVAAPGAPTGAPTAAPAVQQGGAPPAPPGAAAGNYAGGGFGRAMTVNPNVGGQQYTGGPPPPVIKQQPIFPAGKRTADAIMEGVQQAQATPGLPGGVMAAGPAAPTTAAPAGAGMPEPGWGTGGVGSYGAGSFGGPAAPAAPVTPPATTPPAPPTATALVAPTAQMPADLQTDDHHLTPRDKQELAPLFDAARQGRIPLVTLQNEVQQRQTANLARQDKWQSQQHQAMEDARQAEELRLRQVGEARQAAAAEDAHAKALREAADAAKLQQSKSDEADAERVLFAIAPKVRAGEPLTESEADQYDVARRRYARGPLQQVPDGKGGTMTAYAGQEVPDRFPLLPGQKEYAGLKPIPGTERPPDFAPANAMTAMLDIGEGNRKIVKALDQLDAYPAGIGPMRGNLPNVMSNWTDPEGVKVRAAIGDVQGHIYHSLAGSAQSAQESGRLRTFVPGQTDDAEAAKTKLRSMLDSNRQTLLDHYRAFGPDAGGRRQPNFEEEILSTIPPTAIDHLKDNPKLAKDFDKQFGRGAAKLALQNG